MASLTIRKLDDAIRDELRLRAARNGRSVEDEVRVILREAAHHPMPAPASPQPISQALSASRGAGADHQLPRVTLIIGGGIAAYKALDLIRRLKERRIHVRCVLTRAAQQFVTPLSASALSNERAYTDLFDAASEFDAGHIRLGRDCDLIVVAPATADLMAKMAQGHADDLASAILLAANRPILLAPAMNPLMWNNAATRRNVAQLERDGVALIGPNAGEMAEANEAGVGRMAEPMEIAAAAETEHLIDNARAKLARKGCDWIVANDVSPATGVMGGDRNTIHLLTGESGNITVDSWPVMTKQQVATELVARIASTVEKAS